MTDDLDNFWRDVVATKRRAEADEAEELQAAERQFALDDAAHSEDAAEPWSDERIEAAVQQALAPSSRVAEPAATVEAPRRRWTPLRILVAALVLVFVGNFAVAGARWTVRTFREIVLHRTAQTVTYPVAIRVLLDARHHPDSRQSSQLVIDGHLRRSIDVLKTVAAEAGPIRDAARTTLGLLRVALHESGRGDDVPLSDDVVPLAEAVGDSDLPVAERLSALRQLTPLLLEGIAALTTVAAQAPTGDTEALQRHNRLTLERLEAQIR